MTPRSVAIASRERARSAPGQLRAKRAAGRTDANRRAYIRAVGVRLDADDRAYLRGKLDRKLSKFSSVVERASVRVKDVNGPRGGVDKLCRIKVVLSGLPSIVVEERHHSLRAAMDGALERTERAVRQAAGRRRSKPRRARRNTEGTKVWEAP